MPPKRRGQRRGRAIGETADAVANRNRGALPAHLPRFEVVIDVESKQCPCCGGALHVIGEDRSEQLDIVPSQLRVKVVCRPRYACRACEGSRRCRHRRRNGRSTAAWPRKRWWRERAIRPVTITRKNSLFAGSDAGARRWAIANTLTQTCKLNGNDVEPLAYLTDVLQRIISGRSKKPRTERTAAVELASASHHRRRVSPLRQITVLPHCRVNLMQPW